MNIRMVILCWLVATLSASAQTIHEEAGQIDAVGVAVPFTPFQLSHGCKRTELSFLAPQFLFFDA